MPVIQLLISPREAVEENLLKEIIAEKLNVNKTKVFSYRILRKSIDARGGRPRVNLEVEVFLNKIAPKPLYQPFDYKSVAQKKQVIIIGYGPAGMFAALKLLELGLKPIVIERGKNVHNRKTDIALINRNNGIDEESNYCFGEGGAGTFSDGKLYSRSKKKGNLKRVFETFHFHGADDNILYEAHPHIGSDKLPIIVENITKTIIEHGGEVHFEEKVSELIIENQKIRGCRTEKGLVFEADSVILATGHSAHDVYEMLFNQNIALEQKGFAMGVRVEHQQTLIDSIQYHRKERGDYLPAASYNLVTQVLERGVYSFCMCPGGHIVPACSGKNEIVVNGMSASKRNSPFANSGIVVEIRPEDIPAEFQQYGTLAGLKFQQYIENLAFKNNGGGFTAPAQRLQDFVKGRLSADLPKCSYLPGVISSPMHFWLPEFISTRLREGFKHFDKKMRGFVTNNALVVGVETRSSSPVRIPRNTETLQHTEIEGLFPAGEGSGYAGGITSSAIDGENVAVKVFEMLNGCL
jgi:Uncharacterized FAD-dependent dehydrogenases